jgi:pantoate--beta-alanine ligase
MSKIIKSLAEWRALRQQDIFNNKKIGVVLTMGNLHRGHQSLLARSATENAYTVLSLFINPTQFNNAADLATYPRTHEQDIKIAHEAAVDFILCPDYAELYPDNYRYKVSESELSQRLCGKHRPGHFDGVLTVVLKLLQLVKARRTYFGEKDFQQLQLVTEMARAFFVDTEIVACPTVRDENGLALSSRNNRLTPEQYQLARRFPQLLNSENSVTEISAALTRLGFTVDYVEDYNGRRFGAVHVGQVRLIDNFPLADIK